jgi:hypothetical protein
MYITTLLNVSTNEVSIISVCRNSQDSTSSILDRIERYKEKQKDLNIDVRMKTSVYIEVYIRNYFGSKYLDHIYEINEFNYDVDESEDDELDIPKLINMDKD